MTSSKSANAGATNVAAEAATAANAGATNAAAEAATAASVTTATTFTRQEWPRRAVVTAGMPYGNKPLHFGHIAGVFVPADCYARFLRDRIGADNVRFVSGTDCFGSPIDEGYRKLVEAGPNTASAWTSTRGRASATRANATKR